MKRSKKVKIQTCCTQIARLFMLCAVVFVSSSYVWAQKTNCPPGFDAPYCDKTPPALDRPLEKPPVLSNDLFGKAPEPPTLTQYEAALPISGYIPVAGTPTFGALAKDPWLAGVEGVGVANNRLTEEDAMLDALAVCAQNGGKECFVEEVYSNRCLGLALNEQNRLFWAQGRNADNASLNVLDLCSQKSNVRCELIYNGCSYAVPVL